jgi:NTE family protein
VCRRADLVLEGGSAKALAHIGVLKAFEERNWHLQHIAGASGGAIVAALAAAGYRGTEWDDFVTAFDFNRLMRSLRSPSGFVRSFASLVRRGWANDASYLREFLDAALAAKGKTTFGDFRVDDGACAPVRHEQCWSILVVVADITHRRLLRLPQDFRLLGVDPDEQSVAAAVCASAAIPWVFPPITLGAADKAVECIDGGYLSVFPIDVFDRLDGGPARWPTFGSKVWPEQHETLGDRRRLPMFRIGRGLVSAMLVGRDQAYLARDGVRDRVIFVDATAVGSLPMDIAPWQRALLVDNGRRAARTFLDRWEARCAAGRQP